MKITKELVEQIINDGGASAIDAAKKQVNNLADQMNLDLAGNKSGKLSTTIKLNLNVTIDGNKRSYEVEGSYGYAVPNLGFAMPKIVRDIPDPDQGEILDSDGNPIGKNK